MSIKTTHVSGKAQMVVTFRYEVQACGEILGFFHPENQTAEALSTVWLNKCESLVGNNKDKLVTQIYDGAAALTGARSDVQKWIKEVLGNAHFVHFYAHQLNLILEKAVPQNTSLRVFFNSLSRFPAFFSNSPQRIAVLEEIAQTRVPRLSSTR